MVSRQTIAIGREKLWAIAAGAIPFLFFIGILLIRIPAAVSRALSAYSFPFFLLVLVLYYLSFGLSARYRWLASAGLTMLLLGLTLSFLWHSGYSDDKIIGGLLPFRDGFDYYNGANWLLSGHSIQDFNEGAAWRPLAPGFLSVLLWLTRQNLQWALAIQVALAGLCLNLSAYQVRNQLGQAAAAVYLTLLYFYIQPLLGTAYTETLGLALGCLGFVLLWEAPRSRRPIHLIAGTAMLMLAVSARAGAFLIFPLLIVWTGWAWRGQGRFSFRYAGIALATVVVTYGIANTAYNRLVVEPGGFPFGNFAFTIYGQVSGGAGYHKAFEDLGVRDPAVILRAAERFFLAHPASFAIGAAKAYRDFFSPQWGVLNLGNGPIDSLVWIAGTLLLLFGIYRAARQVAAAEASLLLAGFIGIFLSIPFLPPIDGGIRIYASTMPFVYVLPALALGTLMPGKRVEQPGASVAAIGATVALVLAVLTVVAPVLIRHLLPQILIASPSCPAGQIPYATAINRGSYIDLLPEGSSACGTLPEVCLAQFRSYGALNDPSDVAVFDHLAAAADSGSMRVFAGNDQVGRKPHLFIGSTRLLNVPAQALITGCATETQFKGRPSLYTLQTLQVATTGP